MKLISLYINLLIFYGFSFIIPLLVIFLISYLILFLRYGAGKRWKRINGFVDWLDNTFCFCIASFENDATAVSTLSSSMVGIQHSPAHQSFNHFNFSHLDAKVANANKVRVNVKRAFRAWYTIIFLIIPLCIVWFYFEPFNHLVFGLDTRKSASEMESDGLSVKEAEREYQGQKIMITLAKVTLCVLITQAWFTIYMFAKARSIGLFQRSTKYSWRDYFCSWNLSTIASLLSCRYCYGRRRNSNNNHAQLQHSSSLLSKNNMIKSDRDTRTGVWIALSGGGIRAAAIVTGALERLEEIGSMREQYIMNQKIQFDKEFSIKGISAVSGGGYAGSSYLLWRKKIKEDASKSGQDASNWFQRFKNHIKLHIGFMLHWKEITNDESSQSKDIGFPSPLSNFVSISTRKVIYLIFHFVNSIWISFFDAVWAVVFLLVSPFVISIMSIAPVLIILVDVFEFLIYFSQTSHWNSPLIAEYCLDDAFGEIKTEKTTSWETWVSEERKCQFSSVLVSSPRCNLIEFHDPFPSIFLFDIVSCGLVLLLSFTYCVRFGFPFKPFCNCGSRMCVDPQDYSVKGGITHTLIVLILSALGYCAAINANLYKCTSSELIIRLCLYFLMLLNVIIPLLSYERFGGVLFMFTLSSLIVASRMQGAANTSHSSDGIVANSESTNIFTSWFFAYVIAGFLITISPLLNYARFFVFSHYYRHRISKSYYPSYDTKFTLRDLFQCNIREQFPIKNNNVIQCVVSIVHLLIKKILGLMDIIFRCFRFPFNFQGGFFYINEEELRNITGENELEYISQISVHNVSDHYDRPDMFMSDSTISKDILIASSKYGYATMRKNKIDRVGKWKVRAEISKLLEEVHEQSSKISDLPGRLKTLVKAVQDVVELQQAAFHDQKNLVTTGGSLREAREHILSVGLLVDQLGHEIGSVKLELKEATDIRLKTLLRTIRRLHNLLSTTQNENWEKEPLVATVTAISGGAFSPNFGDQAPNSPTSLIGLLGGFCGRWIDIKKRKVKFFWIDLSFSVTLAIISCFIIASGLTLMQFCVEQSLCSRRDSLDTRFYIFWVEIALVLLITSALIILIMSPDKFQKWGLVSHPLAISFITLLNVPFQWSDITSLFASDGGHYENLGVIPLFVHKELKDNDVILSIDSTGETEMSSGLKNSDAGNEIKVNKDDISPLRGTSLAETKRGEFVKFDKDQRAGKFLKQLNSSIVLIKDGDGNNVEIPIECIISPKDLTLIRPGDVINYYEHGMMVKPVDEYGHICRNECKYVKGLSNSEFIIRKQHREEYHDDEVTLFLALKLVKEYAEADFEYEFKADIAELKDYLGEKTFLRLTYDQFLLLQCVNHDPKLFNPPKPTRPRYLRIEVKRKSKKDGKIINFSFYHIRPRSQDIGSEFETSLLGPRFFDTSGLRYCCAGITECLKRTFNFSVFGLRIQQTVALSILLFFIIGLFVAIVHFISGFLLNEMYYSDGAKSLSILISVFLGVFFVIISFALGSRRLAVFITPIAFVPLYLSYTATTGKGLFEFWLIVGAVLTLLVLLTASFAPTALFGVFPNQNTMTMQPFGNSYIFDSYSIQGYQGVEDAWYDVLNQRQQSNGKSTKTIDVEQPSE